MKLAAFISALALGACSSSGEASPPATRAPVMNDPLPVSPRALPPFFTSEREALDASDRPTRLSLASLQTSERSLLVLRVHAGAWCGTCQWSAAHTADFMREVTTVDVDARVVDVLVSDRDNAPASLSSLKSFRGTMDTNAILSVIDPEFDVQALLPSEGTAAPFVLILNAASLDIVRTASNPDPASLARILREAAQQLRPSASFPELQPEELVDNVFHANEWDMLKAMTAPALPPRDPSNMFADNPDAAALGKALFGDASLSPSGSVSCASCHDETKGWSDGLALAKGVKVGTRRSPSIRSAASARSLFWDGRSSSLWGQALMPIENPLEMDSSRAYVAHRVASHYREAYTHVFGECPPAETLPSDGRPGQPSYDALPQATRDAVTRIYVNVGKAIAAYERTLQEPETALDRYVGGDHSALTAEAKVGLSMFFRSGCTQCHYGPRLTDDAFHNVGFGSSDEGRFAVLGSVAEFGPHTPYSDAPVASLNPPTEKTPAAARLLRGAFKTPSLRGVATRTPLGHDGSLGVISDVTEHYADRGAAKNASAPGYVPNPWLQEFGTTAAWSIPKFLTALQ